MPIVRLPSGELRDEIRQAAFDTVDFAAAVSPVGEKIFFQSVTGKTPVETNMKSPGQFPTATSFRIQGLAIDAQNSYIANAQALALILENTSLVLNVGEKRYWEGPLRFAAGRLSGYAAGATDIVQEQYGFPAVQGIILGAKHTVDINPLQGFNLVMTTQGMTAAEIVLATPAADTRLRFVGSLKGLLRRPVQ